MLTILQMVRQENWERVWGGLMAKVFVDEFAPTSLKAAASAVLQVVRAQTLGELSQKTYKQMALEIVHEIYSKVEIRIVPGGDIISAQLREEAGIDAN